MYDQIKVIDTHPNYRITSDGRVINKYDKEKVLDGCSKDGYLKVNLYNDGVGSSKRVHRLVAEAFIPNPDNKPDVNHKNGNKHDNCVDNLEWVTKSENMKHAYQTGLAKPHPTYGMLGKKNPNGGSKGKPVRILETGEEFNSIKDCADSIGGRDRGVCDCLTGRQHTHRGYHFEYI